MGKTYDFPQASFLTVAALGEPGHRVFLMQAEYLGEMLTLKVEKSQLASLVQYLAQMIAEIKRPGELQDLPPVTLGESFDWIAGAMALSYDDHRDTISISIEEASEDEDRSRAHIGITREQAAALAIQGTRLVQSGRPPCPLCGYPLDPAGHSCPRTNGHSAPSL